MVVHKLVVRSYEHRIDEELEIPAPEPHWQVMRVNVSPHPMWDTLEMVTVVWRVREPDQKKGPF
jgi:hypothetical protein